MPKNTDTAPIKSPPPLRGRVREGGQPLTTRARHLRRTSTDAERKLWSQLRAHRLERVQFRRQQPIGPYIADFYCAKARLVIEVDGGQHAHQTNVQRDAKRTKWLEQRGFKVLRFWNNDVLENIDGVLEVIRGAIRKAPPPRPSPSRGEGDNATNIETSDHA